MTTTTMTPLEQAAEEQREEARRDQRIRIARGRLCPTALCNLSPGHAGAHMRQDGSRCGDLHTILAAAQAARLDAQLVAEWEARS
jgi:hypothetical protein